MLVFLTLMSGDGVNTLEEESRILGFGVEFFMDQEKILTQDTLFIKSS